MSELLAAAKEIGDWLEDQRLGGCIIGGLAVQRWGEPRLTRGPVLLGAGRYFGVGLCRGGVKHRRTLVHQTGVHTDVIPRSASNVRRKMATGAG